MNKAHTASQLISTTAQLSSLRASTAVRHRTWSAHPLLAGCSPHSHLTSHLPVTIALIAALSPHTPVQPLLSTPPYHCTVARALIHSPTLPHSNHPLGPLSCPHAGHPQQPIDNSNTSAVLFASYSHSTTRHSLSSSLLLPLSRPHSLHHSLPLRLSCLRPRSRSSPLLQQ